MDKGDKLPPDLRAQVATLVELTSLRHVAGLTGASRSAVHAFVKGSSPHPRTRQRLLAWYEKRSEPPTSTPNTRRSAGHAGEDEAREQVRELVRQRVERTSLRALEKELGINRSTIHKFLDGATPHARLWRSYREWYDQHADEMEPDTRYRDVPVPELRGFFQRIVDEDSVRVVAEAAGMVRNTVAKFVNGADPDPQTVRLLGLYYVYETEHGSGRREAARNRRAAVGHKARQKRPPFEETDKGQHAGGAVQDR